MDSSRAVRFAADVERNAPLVGLGGAILIDLPSLIGMFHDTASATGALVRLLVAYLFAFVATRLVGALLVRYTNDAARREEEQAAAEAES